MTSDTRRYDKMDLVDGLIYELITQVAFQGGVELEQLEWDIEIIGDVRDKIVTWLKDKGLIDDYHDVYPCCHKDGGQVREGVKRAAEALELLSDLDG